MNERQVSASSVTRFLHDRYRAEFARRLVGTPCENFDLLASGVIDSMGVLEMLLAIESEFGVRVDMEGIDVCALTRIGPLSRYVSERAVAIGAIDRGDSSPPGPSGAPESQPSPANGENWPSGAGNEGGTST